MCSECHMIISEPRFAAAYRDPDGTPSIFDDIGDMIDHGEGEAALDEVTAWVHDYHDGKWIDAPDAWFVSGSDTTTPMAGNIVAFRTQGSARDFIRSHGGELRSWSTLIEERSVDAGAEPDSEHGRATEFNYEGSTYAHHQVEGPRGSFVVVGGLLVSGCANDEASDGASDKTTVPEATAPDGGGGGRKKGAAAAEDVLVILRVVPRQGCTGPTQPRQGSHDIGVRQGPLR